MVNFVYGWPPRVRDWLPFMHTIFKRKILRFYISLKVCLTKKAASSIHVVYRDINFNSFWWDILKEANVDVGKVRAREKLLDTYFTKVPHIFYLCLLIFFECEQYILINNLYVSKNSIDIDKQHNPGLQAWIELIVDVYEIEKGGFP